LTKSCERTSSPTNGAMAWSERALLGPHLRETSRSFYLSVRILPPVLRRPVGTAYLLARIADTLADSPGPKQVRRAAVLSFREAIRGGNQGFRPPAVLGPVPPGERRLLEATPSVLSLLASFPLKVRRCIQQVVLTLTEGMLFDFEKFGEGTSVVALETEEELDRYTYLIAGCVGAFWTDLAILAGQAPACRRRDLAELGVQYGKGLQLINILRDMRGDLLKGRVYLPEEKLRAVGLRPSDLADPGVFPQLATLYKQYLHRAYRLLDSGRRYVLSLPRRSYRLRLATIWPLWIGLATLRELGLKRNVLEKPPIRIPRSRTYKLLALSLVAAPFNTLLGRATLRLAALPH